MASPACRDADGCACDTSAAAPAAFSHLLRFRSTYADFRFPELASVAALCDVAVSPHADAELAPAAAAGASPFLRVRLANDGAARTLAARMISLHSCYSLLAEGPSHTHVVRALAARPGLLRPFFGRPFKLELSPFGRRHTQEERLLLMGEYASLEIWDSAPVSLSAPENVFAILEEFPLNTPRGLPPRRVFFGHLLAPGQGHLIESLSLKKRRYIGLTSMPAEISVLIANQAHARAGALVLDPFAGTGSLLVACAHFGACTMGSDIDIRCLRGTGPDRNFRSNFRQYGLERLLVDVVAGDMHSCVWRAVGLFDAIVCDPPYGVREGCRKVGRKERQNRTKRPAAASIAAVSSSSSGGGGSGGGGGGSGGSGGGERRMWQPHHSQKVPYAAKQIYTDLLRCAAALLRPGGRLVFFVPIESREEFAPPTHPRLRLVACSEDVINLSLRRFLVTMEKLPVPRPPGQ